MKYINWLIGSLLTLAFLSCMDDKGSYDYTKLDEPVWKLREGSNTIWVECRAGEMAKFKSTPFFHGREIRLRVLQEYVMNGK